MENLYHIDEISQLAFLDLTVSFGRPAVPFTGTWVNKRQLEENMACSGIQQAAVYHLLSKTYDAAIGNQLLNEELKDATNLIPTWVVVPSFEAAQCTPEEFTNKLKDNGIKAVRLFPSSTMNPASATRYAFTKWLYGDFLEAFQKQNIPLMLEFSPGRRDEPDWERIYRVAKEFPDLKIVLSDSFQRTTWSFIKLLRECPNLYVQTSGLDVHRQLEYMVQHVGADRFLAGSKFPVSSFGTMIGQVFFSALSFKDKKKIAGDNARSLLGISH